jgi:hypothetical protein
MAATAGRPAIVAVMTNGQQLPILFRRGPLDICGVFGPAAA